MSPGYVDPNTGRIRVPGERADVAALKARISALSKEEKDAVRAWLAEAKIPDSRSAVTEAQVRAVNDELDRRAALAAPTQTPEALTEKRFDMPVDYARTYAKHPRKAAMKLVWVSEQCRRARARGDQQEADQWDDARGQLEALLSRLEHCRCCGRALRDPVSVAAGIGPECARQDPAR